MVPSRRYQGLQFSYETPQAQPWLKTIQTVEDDSFYVTTKVSNGKHKNNCDSFFRRRKKTFFKVVVHRDVYKKREPSVLLCTMCIPFLMDGWFMQTRYCTAFVCTPEKLVRGGPCCLLKLTAKYGSKSTIKRGSSLVDSLGFSIQ